MISASRIDEIGIGLRADQTRWELEHYKPEAALTFFRDMYEQEKENEDPEYPLYPVASVERVIRTRAEYRYDYFSHELVAEVKLQDGRVTVLQVTVDDYAPTRDDPGDREVLFCYDYAGHERDPKSWVKGYLEHEERMGTSMSSAVASALRDTYENGGDMAETEHLVSCARELIASANAFIAEAQRQKVLANPGTHISHRSDPLF